MANPVPKDPTIKMFLRWYRDRPNGQVSADAIPEVEQTVDGTWPVAIWPCRTRQEAEQRWDRLWKEFGVNAMTYVICY